MSLIKLIAILSSLLFFSASQVWGQQAQRTMTEPLFGLNYNPKKIRFEPAPASVTQRCRLLKGRKLWTYSAWKDQKSDYLIVSGFITVLPDNSAATKGITEPDPAGVVIELRRTECRISTPEMFLSGKVARSKRNLPVEPNEAAINGLTLDAMERYAKAFGGKEVFLNEIRHQGVSISALPSVLRNQLEQVEK